MKKLLKKWRGLNHTQKRTLLATRTVPIAFLDKTWSGLTGREKWYALERQKVHMPFIRKYWHGMSERERILCCRRQKLLTSFITDHWRYITHRVKLEYLLHQTVTDTLILVMFGEFSKEGKQDCLEKGILDRLSIDSMPALIIDSEEFIRQYARERLDKVLPTIV